MVERGVASESTSTSSTTMQRTNSHDLVLAYAQENVTAVIGDLGDEVTRLAGRLTIVERCGVVCIEWTPRDDGSDAWVDVATEAIAYSAAHDTTDVCATSTSKLAAFSVELSHVRSFYSVETTRRHTGPPHIKLIGDDGAAYLPLYFRQKNGNEQINSFCTVLQRYVPLKRSAKECNLILIADEKKEALERSMHELFHNEAQPFFAKLASNPLGTAVTTLGKMGALVHNQMYDAFVDNDAVDNQEQRDAALSLIKEKESADQLRTHDASGFEMVTQLELPDRPIVEREKPLDEETLRMYLNDDGSYRNLRQLKTHIFRGGMEASLRRRLWPLLLGSESWTETDAERQAKRDPRVDQFYRMKLQWNSITDDQETRFQEFNNRKAAVAKDVNRTDRTLRHYKGEENANLQTLHDILMTYCMYNFDLGYVQGMSDFLSPILYVLGNEVDAFWAFVALMERIHANFEMDQSAIRNQLMQLRDLLMVVNPRLANYLESHDSSNMYFSFRWLIVHFKREFAYADVQRLWEVLWTFLPCDNFHLLVCVAILDRETHCIIENKYGLSEILKHVNGLSMNMNVEEVLSSAEAIYHQLAATQDKLPAHICQILGFETETTHADGRVSSNEPSPVHTAK